MQAYHPKPLGGLYAPLCMWWACLESGDCDLGRDGALGIWFLVLGWSSGYLSTPAALGSRCRPRSAGRGLVRFSEVGVGEGRCVGMVLSRIRGWRLSSRRSSPAPEMAPPVLWLQLLLGRPVSGPADQHLGHIVDLRVRRVASRWDVLDAVLVDAGGLRFQVSPDSIISWRRETITVREVPRRIGAADEATDTAGWLATRVIGKPILVGTGPTRTLRVADLGLCLSDSGRWTVWAIDTRAAWARVLGLSRRTVRWSVLTRRSAVGQVRRARTRGATSRCGWAGQDPLARGQRAAPGRLGPRQCHGADVGGLPQRPPGSTSRPREGRRGINPHSLSRNA